MKTIVRSLVLFFFAIGLAGKTQEITADRDVSFGEIGGQKLLLDVFYPTPAAAKPRPAIILVHGGGWGAGNKESFDGLAMGLAYQGYVAFTINYRLASNGRSCWPAQLDDAQRGVRWVRAHAEKYGIDPKRIGALGHSAGGHLVTCLGTRETRDNSDASLAAYSSRVACVVDLSGPVDLVHRENSLGDGAVQNLLGGSTIDKSAEAKDASPLYNVDAKSAPFLIVHGETDEIVPSQQAERLDAALRKAGVESKLIIFEKEGHTLLKKENSDRMIREILEFLKKHLSP